MTWRGNSKRHDDVRQAANVAIEGMETGLCLSATTTNHAPPPPPPPPPPGINLNKGHLTVVGSYDDANAISVALDGTNVDVTLNGTSKVFAASDVQCVDVVGGEENDVITVNLA